MTAVPAALADLGAQTSGVDAAAAAGGSAASLETTANEAQTKVVLKLILVSGQTKEFYFTPNDSAANIVQYVHDNWPSEWDNDKVENASMLKLIYHGRFLHGSVTLGALGLPVGKTTVMHLVARENLPEPNGQDPLKKAKTGCCSCCCTIL